MEPREPMEPSSSDATPMQPDAPYVPPSATVADEPAATTQAPRATVNLGRISGDLLIRQWDGEADNVPHIRMITEDGKWDVPADQFQVSAPSGDIKLLVAGTVDLTITAVAGDLTAGHLQGALDVDNVEGDATLDDIASAVTLGTVHGDATAVNLSDDLTLVTVMGDVAIDRVQGAIRLDTVHGDLNMRHAGQVDIANCKGDLRAQDLTMLTVSKAVHGDATVAHVTRCTIHEVKGDLTVLDLRELLQVPQVHGDVRLRDIEGQVRLAEVKGDIAAQELLGGILAESHGEAYLESRLMAGMTYQITASEIVLRARSPISAQFVAQSEGGEIRTHLPLTVERHRQALAGVLGQGEATVTLTSTHGDILLDAAGTEDDDFTRHKPKGKHGFRVRLDADGINVEGIPGMSHINFDEAGAAFGWPFRGGFSMSDNANTPRDFSEMEERLKDLGERTGRAAKKAAEKVRDYTDRLSKRARETDWDAVSRDVRTVIERTVGELESTFREIAAEFEKPGSTTGSTTGSNPNKTAGPTAQRVTIERDPIDATATPLATDRPTTPRASAADTSAQRRTILEQVKSGDLTLEEAEEKLRGL